ncbi:cytochrome d ubiquinol oxidase subunit II [Paraburkholderia nemoris]|uniref:cytochrome d ubiquinol oxidase subunit II n=1 Tax=Paraburkholderia nemoris TaxID=2793076 RepID=UPI001B0C6F36|nr:cytochrome d ubiquinol oxidase subunit II [Paraburkholderia nemoris]CAE6806154.1 Cytochrome bd-I ubiquinol oxidase subunit 2 [Paraburkholderia nemoris]
MFEPDTLRLVWWLLIVVLFAGFVVTDGFDLGALILLPWIGKTDEQRRVVLNAVGATWEGNQTWLITAVGATFAAFPAVYSVSFSGTYMVMMLALFALFARPVGFDYRSKLQSRCWRSAWDWALFTGGLVPTIAFGLLVGNLFIGLPFHLDSDFRAAYSGHFTSLFQPFAVLVAIASVTLCAMHGGAYVQGRTEPTFARVIARRTTAAALIFALLFAIGGAWLATSLPGLRFDAATLLQAPAAGSVQLPQQVAGGWIGNFVRCPGLLALPLLAVLGATATALLSRAARWTAAFCSSSLAVLAAISTAGVTLFPVLLASSMDPASSLTLWNASSSPKTLKIMLIVAALFVPLIVLYTGWVYRVLRGPITVEDIQSHGAKLY